MCVCVRARACVQERECGARTPFSKCEICMRMSDRSQQLPGSEVESRPHGAILAGWLSRAIRVRCGMCAGEEMKADVQLEWDSGVFRLRTKTSSTYQEDSHSWVIPPCCCMYTKIQCNSNGIVERFPCQCARARLAIMGVLRVVVLTVAAAAVFVAAQVPIPARPDGCVT